MNIPQVQYTRLKVVKNTCMMCSGVRCIQVSLHNVMVMVSLMCGTSIKTSRVQSYTLTHSNNKQEKTAIDNKKKAKPSHVLNGQETEEESPSVIRKVT